MKIIKQIVETSIGTQREEFVGPDDLTDVVYKHYKDTMLANGRAILAMTLYATGSPVRITQPVAEVRDEAGNVTTPASAGGDIIWSKVETVGLQDVPFT